MAKVIPFEEVVRQAGIIPIEGEQVYIYDHTGLEQENGVPYPRYISITSHRILGILVTFKTNPLSYFLGLIGNFIKPNTVIEERFNIPLQGITSIKRAKFGMNNQLLDIYYGGESRKIAVRSSSNKYNFSELVQLIANNIKRLNPSANVVITEDSLKVG